MTPRRTEIVVKTGTVAIPTDAASVRHARNVLYAPRAPLTGRTVQQALDQAAALIGTGGSGGSGGGSERLRDLLDVLLPTDADNNVSAPPGSFLKLGADPAFPDFWGASTTLDGGSY